MTLADWLQYVAKPAPENHWTTKLWQSAWHAQENVFSLRQVRDPPEESGQQQQSRDRDEDEGGDDDDDVDDDDDDREPTSCVVMQGVEGEFEGHDISAVLMRSEYLNLMRALISFIKGIPLPETERLDNWAFTYLKNVPENPFASYRVKKDRAFMIVSGSPGSGKSLFLHTLLGLRLNARLPTAFQVGEGPIYLFTELGCHVVDEEAHAHDGNSLAPHVPGIWCLTDGSCPPFLYQSDLGTVVHVAPAPYERISLMWPQMIRLVSSANSRVSIPPIRLFFMPVFTLREAMLARNLQISGPKPTDEQLEEWFYTFTPNLRIAFANAHDQATYKTGLMERVPFDTERGLVAFMRKMNKFEDVGDHNSEFFCWDVQGKDYKAEGNFVSKMMTEVLIEYLGATTLDAKMAAYARLFTELMQ